MKKAHYHQEPPNKALLLTVVKTNDDGTVDLGHGDEKNHTLVVGSCPLSEVPKVGHAVLVDGKAEKAPDEKKEAKDANADADTAGTAKPQTVAPKKAAAEVAKKAGK